MIESSEIVEEQIKKLQTLKMMHLISLEKYPALNMKDIREEKEKETENEATNIIDSLQVWECPRKRLMCKLAFDVFELSEEIEQKSTETLKQQVQSRYLSNKEKFLMDFMPVHQLLRTWYVEIMKKATSLNKENRVHDNILHIKDKFAYHVEYQPFCSKCGEIIGLSNVIFQDTFHKKQKSAFLSFSTRFRGHCLRVMVEGSCKLCISASEKNIPTDKVSVDCKDLTITIDPCIGDLDKLVSNFYQQSKLTVTKIVEEIWLCVSETV